MLVGRWGLLRRALPSTLSLRKVTALVMCLCKLHNFLVNQWLKRRDQGSLKSKRKPSKGRIGLSSDDAVDEPLVADLLELAAQGGVPLESRADDGSSDLAVVPAQLMDGVTTTKTPPSHAGDSSCAVDLGRMGFSHEIVFAIKHCEDCMNAHCQPLGNKVNEFVASNVHFYFCFCTSIVTLLHLLLCH